MRKMTLPAKAYNKIAMKKGWGLLAESNVGDKPYITFMPTLCKVITKKRMESEAQRRAERKAKRV